MESVTIDVIVKVSVIANSCAHRWFEWRACCNFSSRGRLNLVLFFCLVNFNDCKFDKCVFIDDRLLSAN